MKREDILSMSAGRELDNEVAITVLGITKLAFTESGELWTPEWKLAPHYSTDISAAWEVVGKFDEEVLVRWRPHVKEYRVWIHRSGKDDPTSGIVVHSKTAPEAICKAALIAVLEESL